ncbi:8028_t:CDS:2, partial [Diversispora eburnea]
MPKKIMDHNIYQLPTEIYIRKSESTSFPTSTSKPDSVYSNTTGLYIGIAVFVVVM